MTLDELRQLHALLRRYMARGPWTADRVLTAAKHVDRSISQVIQTTERRALRAQLPQ